MCIRDRYQLSSINLKQITKRGLQHENAKEKKDQIRVVEQLLHILSTAGEPRIYEHSVIVKCIRVFGYPSDSSIILMRCRYGIESFVGSVLYTIE
eukprot:TRINITY_DN3852_c0_g1_i4.p2 TRINITY_DN3852_c0_g1~~TRINITY_DN3852_c0_g1_i4.p2  ORF type:complete len:111 (-),score=5.11 TRINITY_DN3852_c0_g1_i4:515-799(-)